MKKIDQHKYWEREELFFRRPANHEVVEFFVNSKLTEIQKSVPMRSETRILELGSGNGFFSYQLDKFSNLLASDYSEQMLSLNPVKNKIKMDAANIKFDDNSFDIVFESSLLHHVHDISDVISEMKRVSNKYLIFIEPNRTNPLVYLFCLVVPEERAALRFSLNYIKNIILEHDLKIITAYSHGIIAPNKTPLCILPLLKKFDRRFPLFGFDNIVICEK